jgi:hypothetical protein
MKQQQTIKLYDYWNELYQQHGIPERSLIEPAAIIPILGDTFILEFAGASPTRYRLAGTRLCASFGHELKGQPFISDWHQDDKSTIANILVSVASESVAVVLGSSARSKDGRTLALETLILPLLHNQQAARRFMGITTPVHRPYWLGTDPIGQQTLTSMRVINPVKELRPFAARFKVLPAKPPADEINNPPPLPVGKRVGHLVVLEGGRGMAPEKTLL